MENIYEIKGIESEEFEDVLNQFLILYKIELKNEELIVIKSFKELVNLVLENVTYHESLDCSSQQAFYKLKRSIYLNSDYSKEILLTSELNEILPKKNRRKVIKRIEHDLGFKLNVLQPKEWILKTLFVFILLSFVMLFIKFSVGFPMLLSLILLLKFVYKYSKEFKGDIFRDLVEQVASENYFNVRKDKETINKKEFEKVIYKWFSQNTQVSIFDLKRAVFI